MITRSHAMDGTVTEFHIAHAGLPCTVWRRGGIAYTMPDGGFFLPVERDALPGEDGRQWHHITGVNAADFHIASECPFPRRTGDDQPPLGSDQSEAQPVLSNGYGEDGYDALGFNEAGYDRNGYDAEGFDADGYDADGYDRNGYDEDGDPRPGTLDAEDLDLADLWQAFTFTPGLRSTNAKRDEFRQHLQTLVADPDEISDLEFCGNCDEPAWSDDLALAGTGERICGDCWADWSDCDHCDERYPDDDMTWTLDETRICDGCRSDYYSFCDNCDGWYPDGDADDHDHSSGGDGCCDSPQPQFEIRNDGCDPLPHDTRITVTLPAGVISGEGLEAIRYYLVRQGLRDLAYDLEKLGDQWQTREGNYVKRLSRHAYQTWQLKLTQDVMSQVGCIARDHSTAVSVEIEVSRDLNASAGYWYHEDSCWWGSYYESRCALKTNGGFGIRSFDGPGDWQVSGRAWVMPLRLDEDGRLKATFATMTADAFVVFNGYGDLSGYSAPRILAHMAGWTYRKIGFSADPMYVNSGGYLVAPEEIAAQYTNGDLYLSISQHARLYENERVLVNA